MKSQKYHMKKILATLVCILSAFLSQAQVSVINSGFTTNLTKNDLPFSGDRKLFATGLNDRLSNNYIVVSKNKHGAENDELYIEKFTETSNQNFNLSFSTKLTHKINLSLAFVNNRMMYSDIDKDGYAEFLFIVDEHTNGVGSNVEKTNGIIVYKNTAYKIWRLAKDLFNKNYYDTNYLQLPEEVRTEFESFWNKYNFKP